MSDESIDILIEKAQDHADIIRMCARTFSEQKNGEADVEAEQFINAMNFANRLVYQHIANLKHCQSLVTQARSR